MCIIMVTDVGRAIPEEHLLNGWANNPDGGGYMFLDENDDIQVRKGLMTLDGFLDEYEKDYDDYGDNSPFVVHFRIGTHGAMDGSMTHPHVVNKRLAMVHNGIISGLSYQKNDSRSDTRVFIDNTLRFLPKKWLDNPAIFELVEDRIKGSKFAFLSTETAERVYILNEHAGTWQGGVWYSNRTYKRSGWQDAVESRYGGYGYGYESFWHRAVDKKEPTLTPSLSSPPGTRIEQVQVYETSPSPSPSSPPPVDSCLLCGEGLEVDPRDPWCWECMWCAVCDMGVRECKCEEWKQSISWGDWGEDWLEDVELEALEEEERDGGYVHSIPMSIHDLTDEEWVRLAHSDR